MEQDLFAVGVNAMRSFENDRAALRAFAESCMRTHSRITDKSSRIALLRLAELALRTARAKKPSTVLDEAEAS